MEGGVEASHEAYRNLVPQYPLFPTSSVPSPTSPPKNPPSSSLCLRCKTYLPACPPVSLSPAPFRLFTAPLTLSLLLTLSLPLPLLRPVDCIDCAAEAAVVNAAQQGIQAALAFAHTQSRSHSGSSHSNSSREWARRWEGLEAPWLMVSISDDEDLHFRKAGETWGAL